MSDLERERERQRRAFAARAGWGECHAPATRRRRLGTALRAAHKEVMPRRCSWTTLRRAIPSVLSGVSRGCFERHGLQRPQTSSTVDETLGFALLEDLGDDSFSSLLAGPDASSLERTLYEAATDFLVNLHRQPVPPDLPYYDPAWMLSDATLFLETAIDDAVEPAMAEEFEAAWREPLEAVTHGPAVLCLRDFHAGNLMWLPVRGDKSGCGMSGVPAGLGCWIFRMHVAGPAAYDLVSLLQDARRDLGAGLEAGDGQRATSMRRPNLMRLRSTRPTPFSARSARCGSSASSIGLAKRDRKPGYLAHLPRVWRHLDANLAHPSLAPVRAWFERWVPPQTRSPAP